MTKVTVRSGNVTVEAEGQKELFKALADFQEVFGTVECKGCKGANLRYVVRKNKDSDGKMQTYYELRCMDCRAKLPFGQHVDSPTLFPKNWVKWDRDAKTEEEL